MSPAIGWYGPDEGAGLIGAMVGSIIVLAVWDIINRRRGQRKGRGPRLACYQNTGITTWNFGLAKYFVSGPVHGQLAGSVHFEDKEVCWCPLFDVRMRVQMTKAQWKHTAESARVARAN
jgi:hypothetical protein